MEKAKCYAAKHTAIKLLTRINHLNSLFKKTLFKGITNNKKIKETLPKAKPMSLNIMRPITYDFDQDEILQIHKMVDSISIKNCFNPVIIREMADFENQMKEMNKYLNNIL